ncbi:MAG: Uma2 family endonuclease [Methylococcales bacterium]|nr:Uma2 family endonuclease [Methylococcales bacterium]
MSAVLEKNRYTAEDYLMLEQSASSKSEFHDGQIVAMTGASRKHNLVSGNICRELSLAAQKTPLRSRYQRYAR